MIENCDKDGKDIFLIKPELKTVLLSMFETKFTDVTTAITRSERFDEWSDMKFLIDACSGRRTGGQLELPFIKCLAKMSFHLPK